MAPHVAKLEGVMKPLWEFEGTFNEANEVADEVWRRAMARLQKVSRSEDYTPMEVQLALADEETVCLTNRDFTRLQELFQFNGIPHYETITPDGRRVHENLSIHGYDDFDSELQRLLEKLK
jgi:hypothetical protein